MSMVKGITSAIVKEGDILVIEGGIARHIINPKKRGDKVAGAYATAYNDNLLPSTVFVDVSEASDDDLEVIARKKVQEQLRAMTKYQEQKYQEQKANVKRIEDHKKSKETKEPDKAAQDTGNSEPQVTQTEAKVLSVAAPEFEGDVQFIVACVEGPKGKYNVLARGKHSERLIALEGKTAVLKMTKAFNRQYQAYEAAEVRFSTKRVTVDTTVTLKGGELFAVTQDGKEIKVAVHDLETMQALEDSADKRVRLVLEPTGNGEFVVTGVLAAAEASEQKTKVEEKVS